MPRFLPALLVPLLVFLVHAGGLDSGFHYDDGHSLLRNPHVRSLANLPAFFSDPRAFSENPDYAMYRPLVLVFHALNYAWGGYDPRSYQVLNLIIHCLVSLLVYGLLRQLGLPQKAALLGSLLFGLHPVQTEPVNYINSRSESLAALFYLAAFGTFLKALAPSSSPSWTWYVLSLGTFSLGLLSKSTAVTLPLALLAYEEFVADRSHSKYGKNYILKLHFPFWLLSVLYLVLYRLLASQALTTAGQTRTWDAQLATQTKALVHYLNLVFVPVKMNVYQQFWVSESVFAPSPLLGLLAGLSLLSIAYAGRRTAPLLVFGLGWFVLTLLPTFVVPLHILVNDHRLYLSTFGLSLILGHLALRRTMRWPLGAICLALALISWQRNEVWKDEITLWQDAVTRAPLMPETHYNLGHAHHLTGDLDLACRSYERAVELSPGYARAQANLGIVYREQGEIQRAILAFQTALQEEPERVEILNNLGLIYADEGRFDESITLYHKALAINPHLPEIWLNLGLAYRDKGLLQESYQALRKALQLDPEIRNRFPTRTK